MRNCFDFLDASMRLYMEIAWKSITGVETHICVSYLPNSF